MTSVAADNDWLGHSEHCFVDHAIKSGNYAVSQCSHVTAGDGGSGWGGGEYEGIVGSD